MKTVLVIYSLFICSISFAQPVSTQITNAITALEQDPQFRHAAISLDVINDKTGQPVYSKNIQLGMVPASCQKVVTSITAFEILGQQYTYKTRLTYDGIISNGTLKGNIYIKGEGDPTLGSWRYPETKEQLLLNEFVNAIKSAGILQLDGQIYADNLDWSSQSTPDGWVFQDIGNYYGAGATALNWRENQYELVMASGKYIGDPVKIIRTNPSLYGITLTSELRSAARKSGDNAYIYLPEGAQKGIVRGTIPVDESGFSIAGAMPEPGNQLVQQLYAMLKTVKPADNSLYSLGEYHKKMPPEAKLIFTHTSPPLDSITYWFLKKSINLYGEALLKTIAFKQTGYGYTDTGVALIKRFWKEKGIDPNSLNILDGSGLSPANRVTTNALVALMHFARKQSWFPSFYNALPETHGIRMKDGYIGGVRSFTGYIKSKSGEDYTFSFIINNFDGRAGEVSEKMWKVLDILK